MENKNYSLALTLLKAAFGALLPLLPSLIDAFIPKLHANEWGLPLIVIALAVGALRGLKNYIKNSTN